ncbi:MAG: SHOCT domain-containing protein [Halanaerobiales bacterium]|nr:SHOCT domain-containing protein [Halanaerobiales bacterium]
MTVLIIIFVVVMILLAVYFQKKHDKSIATIKEEFDGIYLFQCNNDKHDYRMAKLYDDRVEIVSDAGERTIYIDQINSVQVVPKSMVTPGYLRIMTGDADDYSSWQKAKKDGNAICLTSKKDTKPAKELEKQINRLRQESRKKDTAQEGSTQKSNAEKIKEFKELLDEGIINEEEFQKKKEELMA